jgi:hypothetical protein
MTSDEDTEPDAPHRSTDTDLRSDNVPDQTLSALDELESLLSNKHELPQPDAIANVMSVPIVDPHPTAGADGPGDLGAEHDGQYTIPLLEDVVKLGQPAPTLPPAPLNAPISLSPVAQRLFERLASEIDVIVQTGVDDALKAAARDIRKRVKQHVAIVLPEILDELANEDDSEF